MSVADQGPKSFDAIVRDIATSAIEQYEGMPARMDFALQSAKARGTVRPILTLRSGLVQYMGAAYFLRDRARFRAAAAAFTAHSQMIAETFAPEPFILVPDLCLALLGAPAKTRRALIQTVWKQDSAIKPSDYSGQPVARRATTSADTESRAGRTFVPGRHDEAVRCRQRWTRGSDLPVTRGLRQARVRRSAADRETDAHA
jgi:hypothetical protein